MTPHINAEDGDIAETVIMPGDPLRAKYIAKKFLKDYKTVNTVRNILGYTGEYEGKRVTVMASGMGNPSMGIYSYELYKFYNVKNIIRVGTAGSYTEELDLRDIALATSCYSESSYAKIQCNSKEKTLYSSPVLDKKIKNAAKELDIQLKEIRVLSSDAFYNETEVPTLMNLKYGCKAVEMESFALFQNANYLGKKASCLLTISDNLLTGERLSSNDREKKLDEMIEIVLKSI